MTEDTNPAEDELSGHIHEALAAIRAESLPAKSFKELTGSADVPTLKTAEATEIGNPWRSRLLGVAATAAAGLLVVALFNWAVSNDDGQTVASNEGDQSDPTISTEEDPPAGPAQLREGDDWRLLLDAPVGSAHASWIATNDSQYEQLLAGLGVAPADPTPVDFEAEVVLWFGVEENGDGCWHSRLDGVIVDSEANLIYGDVAWPTDGRECTSDSAPRAYLVAVARDRLPEPPFSLQSIANIDDFYVTTERTEVTSAVLSGEAPPPSLALRFDGPAQNQPTQQPLDIFGDHSRWMATEFNGQTIVAGPRISSPGFSVTDPEVGEVEGCILGAPYHFSIDGSRLLVDQNRPVGEYDCDDSLVFEQGIEALPDVIFASPEIQLGQSRLELRSGDDSVVFHPFADDGALAGRWIVRTINDAPANNTWELVFNVPNELGPSENGLAQLRLCGEGVMSTTYTPAQIGLSSPQQTDATSCVGGSIDGSEDIPSLFVPYAEIHWLAQDRIRIFDGSALLELEPLAESEQSDDAERPSEPASNGNARQLAQEIGCGRAEFVSVMVDGLTIEPTIDDSYGGTKRILWEFEVEGLSYRAHLPTLPSTGDEPPDSRVFGTISGLGTVVVWNTPHTAEPYNAFVELGTTEDRWTCDPASARREDLGIRRDDGSNIDVAALDRSMKISVAG